MSISNYITQPNVIYYHQCPFICRRRGWPWTSVGIESRQRSCSLSSVHTASSHPTHERRVVMTKTCVNPHRAICSWNIAGGILILRQRFQLILKPLLTTLARGYEFFRDVIARFMRVGTCAGKLSNFEMPSVDLLIERFHSWFHSPSVRRICRYCISRWLYARLQLLDSYRIAHKAVSRANRRLPMPPARG